MLDKYYNDTFLIGNTLVGDEFTIDEISQWYKEEEEAYCYLSSSSINISYIYEKVNSFYGLKKYWINLIVKTIQSPLLILLTLC